MSGDTKHWTRLPKVELHTHLDCGLSIRAVRSLFGPISGDAYRERYRGPERCQDLRAFLDCIDTSLDLLQSAPALTLAAADMADQLAADNVAYAEVRFAPLLHVRDGLNGEDVVEAVLQGFSTSSVPVGVLLCALRHFSTEQGLKTLALAEKNLGNGVVGLDLAGDERNFPLGPHIEVFRRARERDIPYTVHGGEARGADSMREILEHLSPSRVGHGVRSIEDAEVVDMLCERGVHLEVCPSVNLQIGLFPSAGEHPIDRLRRKGVSVGVNTDARATTGVTLDHEYQALAEAFGWDDDVFRQCNRNALAASFAPPSVKTSVGEIL